MLSSRTNIKNNTQTYVLQKGDPNQHTRIIRGDFHQEDERFGKLSRGKQCVATAIVALCFFDENNSPEKWASTDINQILIKGDEQYYASYKKLKREGRVPQTPYLLLSEVYPYIKFGRKFFCVSETDVNSPDNEKNVLKWDHLLTSLNRFFIENLCGVFTCKTYSFAIMRKSDSSFFLFNSRPTSYDGEPIDPCDPSSAACLMHMFTVTCLASHLLVACNQRQMILDEFKYDPSIIYSISSVKIDKKIFGTDTLKRKQINRDLANLESKRSDVDRKRKSNLIGNVDANPDRMRFIPEKRRRNQFKEKRSDIITEEEVNNFSSD